MKGSYCIIIKVNKASYLNVGTLGKVKIESGFYVYVGSAFNSLEARVKRHLSRDKKIYWHVDYLLAHDNVKIEDVIFTLDERRLECPISKRLENPGSIKGFGCSDCNCKSHLHYYRDMETAKNAILNLMEDLGAKAMFLENLNL